MNNFEKLPKLSGVDTVRDVVSDRLNKVKLVCYVSAAPLLRTTYVGLLHGLASRPGSLTSDFLLVQHILIVLP